MRTLNVKLTNDIFQLLQEKDKNPITIIDTTFPIPNDKPILIFDKRTSDSLECKITVDENEEAKIIEFEDSTNPPEATLFMLKLTEPKNKIRVIDWRPIVNIYTSSKNSENTAYTCIVATNQENQILLQIIQDKMIKEINLSNESNIKLIWP